MTPTVNIAEMRCQRLAEKNINLGLLISTLSSIEPAKGNLIPIYRINHAFSSVFHFNKQQTHRMLKMLENLNYIKIRRTQGVMLLEK